ncbi:hypothetical protein G7Y89_g7610 [Cudoniella acicularis]|uniref:Uncharacterized protein n=1 Tax=Cudoniella acicularis TaxID=354080 RepID=A0A8H4RI73_9HELO|nr:hypothetical protein G7Y89_g7610 [Cudoniella acicularis]
MSSSAQEGPGVPGEKKKGLSTLVSRMKTVLRKSDGSKRLSFSSKGATAGPSVVKADALIATPIPEAAEPAEPAEPTTTASGPQPKKIMRSEIDAERARKLGERFRVTIEPHEWSSKKIDKEAYRVEKPIRMRIHRTCHRCNATFGGNKTCAVCEHVRCTKCPRYPIKKPEGKAKEKVVPVVAGDIAGHIEADDYWNLREEIALRKPNPKPNGQPLVRKKPMQRVRRTCHECSTQFSANAKICSNCSHPRCADCPRDPAKKKKYPDGYPGDAPSSDTTKPVKYTCHHCNKNFLPVPHPDSEEANALGDDIPKANCSRCGHQRCQHCPRALPAKVELVEQDPELVKRVEAKLAKLNIDLEVK